MRALCSRHTTLISSLHDQLNLPFVVLYSFTKTVKGRTVPNPTDVNSHSFTTTVLLLIRKIACSNQFSNDLMSVSNGLSLTLPMTYIFQVDVTGHCPTHYRVTQKGWKTMKVTKVKDMLSCTDRHDYRTSLLSTPYRSPNVSLSDKVVTAAVPV